jgi:hypothetical protein
MVLTVAEVGVSGQCVVDKCTSHNGSGVWKDRMLNVTQGETVACGPAVAYGPRGFSGQYAGEWDRFAHAAESGNYLERDRLYTRSSVS